MNNPTKIPTLLATALLFLLSCKKEEPKELTNTAICTTPTYFLQLPEYTGSDADTILVQTFDNDGTFSTPLSAFTALAEYREPGPHWGEINNYYPDVQIMEGYDYLVTIPSRNDTIRIQGIYIEERTEEWKKWSNDQSHWSHTCIDSLHRICTINGDTVISRDGVYDNLPVQVVYLTVEWL